jgi:hypothetical protein
MLEVINSAKAKLRKHPTRGTRAKLNNADKLLLMLMSYREYRRQFHIGITSGISENHVCEIIKEMENMLIQDSRFHLPGKKALLKEENHFEVVLVDVTESPVERPEKTEVELFRRNFRIQRRRIVRRKSLLRTQSQTFKKPGNSNDTDSF